MRAIAVGVDAGGTSTTAVVSRNGEVIGSAVSRGANPSSRGTPAAASSIARAIHDALEMLQPDCVVVGAAGAGRAESAKRLTSALQTHFPLATIEVVDDATIALWAGAPQGEGIVLISGTGSIAHARLDGRSYRSGGYGYVLGDEGSGYALGVAAARTVARAFDGRAPRDAFVGAVAAALGVENLAGLLEVAYTANHPVEKLATLAPLVLEAAGSGDRTAGKIVQNAALELADLVKSVVRAAGIGQRELPLVFSGGVLRANSMLSFLLETRISNDLPNLLVVKDSAAAQFGALRRAQQLLSARSQ